MLPYYEIGQTTVPLGLPILHSKPGSRNRLLLDFDGHTTDSSSQWEAFKAKAYSLDRDFSTFSSNEQAQIILTWQRVVEDFSVFDIDVTTDPSVPMNQRTAHCLITHTQQTNGRNMPVSEAGGVAYLGTFNDPDFAMYMPALGKHYDSTPSQ